MAFPEELFWNRATAGFIEAAVREKDSETLIASLCDRVVGIFSQIPATQSELFARAVSERVGGIFIDIHGENIEIDTMLEMVGGIRKAVQDAFFSRSILGLPQVLEKQFTVFLASIKVAQIKVETEEPREPQGNSGIQEAEGDGLSSDAETPNLVEREVQSSSLGKKKKASSPRLSSEDAATSETTERGESDSKNTGGFDGPSKVYLRMIGRFSLIDVAEERRLAGIMKTGDERSRDAAREKMICANLRLVVHIVKGYMNYGLSCDDLISEGNRGLMTAVERFDPDKGGKLSTYAAWWIKQSIKRALSNQSKTIRVPVHQNDKIAKMKRVSFAMSEELGREPTDDELAAEIGIEASKIGDMRAMSVRPASLDAEIGEDGGTTLGDMVGDGKNDASELLANADLLEKVIPLLKCLDKRERDIIERRFGIGRDKMQTLEEVGVVYGVTRERIRQLQNIALDKLRREFLKKNRNLDTRVRSKKDAKKNVVGIPGLNLPKHDKIVSVPAFVSVAKNGVGHVLSDVGLRSMVASLYRGTTATTPYNIAGVEFELEIPAGDIRATLLDMKIPLRQGDE